VLFYGFNKHFIVVVVVVVVVVVDQCSSRGVIFCELLCVTTVKNSVIVVTETKSI
jgi:hypothetical protein